MTPASSRLDFNPRLLIAAARMEAGQGGIARVARLTALVAEEAGLGPTLVSLLDPQQVTVGGVPVRTAKGSRWLMAAGLQLSSFTHRRVFFDAAGIARSRPLLSAWTGLGVWMHGTEVWEGLKPAGARSLRAANLRVANSQYTRERFELIHGRIGDIQVCHLGTEQDEAPRRPADFTGEQTVLFVGRLDAGERYSKGATELIHCWPEVAREHPRARLVIVGGGTGLEAIARAAHVSAASRAIEVAGFVPESRIEEYWARAHVFAMPSRGEGFGIAYIEAMRRGLPVVASTHDAGREINLDQQTGFNVSLDQPGELASRLTTLLREPELIRRFGSAAHARWRNEFRYSAFSRRFRPLLEGFMRP